MTAQELKTAAQAIVDSVVQNMADTYRRELYAVDYRNHTGDVWMFRGEDEAVLREAEAIMLRTAEGMDHPGR